MRRAIRQFFSGLRLRLLLLVLLACAPWAGLTLHTASEERRQLVKDWQRRAQKMMQLASLEETRLLTQTRQLLLAVAESASIKADNRRDTKKLLDELSGAYKRYSNLGVLRTNGSVLASLRPIAGVPSLANQTFFRRALATRAFAVGDFPDGQSIGKPTLNFGLPVLDPAGQVQAVAFAMLDLDWVSRLESALPAQLPPGATWTEMDRAGKILVRYPSPEKWIGRSFQEKALLPAVFHEPHGVVEAPSADGTSGYHAFAATYSPLISGEVVTILGSVPTEMLFAEANRRLKFNFFGLAVAAGFALALGWTGSHFLVLRPVRTLVNSSARLATGDLSTRTGLPHREDELGQLTRTFDLMAQSLEQREAQHQSASRALEASEIRYRRLFETAHDGILILNAESGQIEDVNPFLTDLLGYTRTQMLGNKLWEIGPFKDIQASQAEFRELQRVDYVRYEDLPLETSAGKSIHVEFVSNVYQVNGVRVIQCNVRDITERKQADEKRQEYGRKLQVLSHRLVEAQETERRNIARELHDEIGQSLTVLQLHLQAILQSPGAGAVAGRAREGLQVVERVLEQVHDISLDLRPSILDDLGLEPALRWYADRQAALVGLTVSFYADRLEHRLDSMIETECFRVAQEALTNVVRHAHARAVTVELQEDAGQVHLRVRDDGIGFDVPRVREKAVRGVSLGLLSMEERASLAGGGLEFLSAPGRGTEVHAWFPLKWQLPSPGSEVP